jgi:hypothetical protein
MKTKVLTITAHKENDHLMIDIDSKGCKDKMELIKILLGITRQVFEHEDLALNLVIMDDSELELFESFKKSSAPSAPLR